MADTGGNEAHQDFVVPRTFQLKGFDLQGAAFFAKNGRLNLVHLNVGIIIHRSTPSSPIIYGGKASPSRKWARMNFTSFTPEPFLPVLVCTSGPILHKNPSGHSEERRLSP
jgi:hypothetical protein